MSELESTDAPEVRITRETFIDEDLDYIAAIQAPKMVTMNEDGSIEHIEVPEIIRKTGIIPDGFSVGKQATLRFT
jgi:hypothetical protein